MPEPTLIQNNINACTLYEHIYTRPHTTSNATHTFAMFDVSTRTQTHTFRCGKGGLPAPPEPHHPPTTTSHHIIRLTESSNPAARHAARCRAANPEYLQLQRKNKHTHTHPHRTPKSIKHILTYAHMCALYLCVCVRVSCEIVWNDCAYDTIYQHRIKPKTLGLAVGVVSGFCCCCICAVQTKSTSVGARNVRMCCDCIACAFRKCEYTRARAGTDRVSSTVATRLASQYGRTLALSCIRTRVPVPVPVPSSA